MKWNKKEEQILLLCNGKFSIKELVEKTGHSYFSVTGKINQLRKKGINIKTLGSFGIKRFLWSKEQIDLLSKVAPFKTIEQIRHEFFPKMTELSIKCKCFRKKIKYLLNPNWGAKGEKSKCWTGYGELDGQRIAGYKQNAKKRKIEFKVTAKYLWKLLEKQNFKCALSGEEIYLNRNSATASPDRIDPIKGYLEGNIQWVHKRVNELKWDSTNNELIKWCKLIVNNNKNYE